MSTQTETSTRRERSVLYIVVVVVLVILAVIALIMFRSARQTAQAEEKAQELIQALEDAGAETTPSVEMISRVLGDDGDIVCADPNGALNRAALLSLLSNGAGGPGIRPVIAESRSVQGVLLIVEVYCPDELEEFQEFIDGLETVDGSGG
ncbi:hypothetical protein [Agromyces bauzanensis]|uniref:Uncharacterized protein n=1 Tax=Agromyces bauzanensis TaxID=1308924 RepID=A0A917PMD8_9MICO|nr:hypothetical protein [Agromyces bauzanensis]GGJ84634.1 hypothetical protein GCM10011372_23680 [Agromyces bauzanensis]